VSLYREMQWGDEAVPTRATSLTNVTTPSGDPLSPRSEVRDAAVSRIQDAFARGDISHEDLDASLSVALSARTPDALRRSVDALPMTDEGRSVTIAAKSGRIRREGEWRVPRFLRIESEYGRVRLDFSRAEFEAPLVDVELDLRFGGAKIILPAHAAIDLDGLQAEWKQPRYPLPAAVGAARPLIRISGSMEYGRLRARRCRP
jgi:hypothetical protein